MQYRRIRQDEPAGAGAAALVGLGLGLAAGFLLGELYAGEGRGGVTRAFARWRRSGKRVVPASELADQLAMELERVLGPDAQSLDLVPVGRNALELHGWVTSRVARTRARQAARAALDPAIKLVDRLLVWGEDDTPLPEIPLREEPESA